MLETLGVPVVGFGTSDFPAFYSRSSGLPAPLRLDTAEEIAAMLRSQRALGFPQGILVANPVPRESEIPAAVVDGWISTALAELQTSGITGKAVTPFLLGKIVELSAGASLETNVALFHNNVRVGCAIAAALCASRQRATASRQRATASRQRATASRQRATASRQRATASRQRATASRQRATASRRTTGKK